MASGPKSDSGIDAPGNVALEACLHVGVVGILALAGGWTLVQALGAHGLEAGEPLGLPPWQVLLPAAGAWALALVYLWLRLRPLDEALARLRAGHEPSGSGGEVAARALAVPVVFLVAPMGAGLVAVAWVLMTGQGAGGSSLRAGLMASVLIPSLVAGLVASLATQRNIQPAIMALRLAKVPVGWRFGLGLRLVIACLAVAGVCCESVVWIISRALNAEELANRAALQGTCKTSLGLAFACLVAGAFGGLLAAGMRRRAKAVTNRLEQMAVEDDEGASPLPVSSATEIGAISAAFNQLVEGLTRERRLLAEYTREESRAERSRAKFLRTMSHELRTPLNSIIGFSDLLAREFDGPLGERQREAVKVINRSGERLLEMINDILLMAQFEADRAVADMHPAALEEVVADALDNLGATIEVHWSADLAGRTAVVDRAMLARALRALAVHAAASPERARAGIQARLGKGGGVWFSILGWQGGCPQEEIERLLDGFRRPSAAGHPQAATIDLGLPLASAVARLHGGQLVFVPDDGVCRIDLVLPPDRLVSEGSA